MTDESLDFSAWYGLVHRRVGAALALAFGDADVAQEAADEAIARAYASWKSVATMASPTGWVFTVAFNVARRRLRRRELERRLLLRSAPPASSAPDIELWLVVAGLPDRQRQAVILRHVGDLREHEIGHVMGITRGGVSSTLRAAYASLRDVLAEAATTEENR